MFINMPADINFTKFTFIYFTRKFVVYQHVKCQIIYIFYVDLLFRGNPSSNFRPFFYEITKISHSILQAILLQSYPVGGIYEIDWELFGA